MPSVQQPSGLRVSRGHKSTRAKERDYSLKGICIFRDATDAELESVAGRCRWRRFAGGDSIIGYQDDTPPEVYFLVTGRARVIIYSPIGRAIAFRDMGAGDVLGEFAAIDEKPRSASVEALADCTVASVPAAVFRDIVTTVPAIALATMQHLVSHIRRLNDRVVEYSTLPVSDRIHAELLRLAIESGPTANHAVITPAPTHADLASRISTHREAVTRELGRLGQDGLVLKRGNALHIKDLAKLSAMVEQATGE